MLAMTDEVYTDCPACGESIPFYETVDDLGACPECATHRDVLFDIAQGEIEVETPAVADGGGHD